MEILYMLIDFFKLDMLSAAQTFPELLQAIIYVFLACMLVLYVVRAVCAMNAHISNGLSR